MLNKRCRLINGIIQIDSALKTIPYTNKYVTFVKIIMLGENESYIEISCTNLQLCKSEIVSKLKKINNSPSGITE